MIKQMNFKLSESERTELKKRASKEMLTVSAYLRRCALLDKKQ